MADKDQPQQPTHRAYSVIKREGQDDYWLIYCRPRSELYPLFSHLYSPSTDVAAESGGYHKTKFPLSWWASPSGAGLS